MKQNLQLLSGEQSSAGSCAKTTIIFTLRDERSGELAVLLSRAPNHPEHLEWGFGGFAALHYPLSQSEEQTSSELEQCVYACTGIKTTHPVAAHPLGHIVIGVDTHEFVHIALEGTLATLPQDYMQKSEELLAWVRDHQWRYDVSKETMGRHVSQARYFVMTQDGEVDVLAQHATFIHDALVQVRNRRHDEQRPASIVQSGAEITHEPLVPQQEMYLRVA